MEKADKIFKQLEKEYPEAKTALFYANPLEILIATILSAQCTDKRVNIITKELFEKYKSVNDYAKASQKEFESEIRSTGFYRQKAKNIIAAAKKIINDFDGKVPKTMDELVALPGVARKTANIVMYSGYGIIEGIAVDTHVKRLSLRLGLSKMEDPVKIEQDLMKLVPKKNWGILSHILIEHGRNICHARSPRCPECILKSLCPSFGKV